MFVIVDVNFDVKFEVNLSADINFDVNFDIKIVHVCTDPAHVSGGLGNCSGDSFLVSTL